MPPRSPLFVERQIYRRRRLMDAARLLPLLGVMLWLVPLLWRDAPGGGVATSGALVYIFGVWALLVLAAGMIAYRLPGRGGESGDGEDGGASG